MTLKDLLDVFDKNRAGIKIQICKVDDWSKFDVVWSDSPVIKEIENKKVKHAGAISEDVIRVSLYWGD